MDDTGAAVPNISIQVSERGIPVDIWITHRDGRKCDARDFGKLSRVNTIRMEKNVSSQSGTHPPYEECPPNPEKDRFPERICRSTESYSLILRTCLAATQPVKTHRQ